MPKTEEGGTSKVLAGLWTVAMLVFGVVNIVVGSVFLDSGCLNMSLLPYYLLLAGVLALVPVVMAILVSCCACRSQLDQLWGLMGTIFLVSMTIRLTGTVYIVSGVARMSSLNRLCTHPWVVIFGLIMVVADWILFAFFCRLFCVNKLPQPTPDIPPFQDYADSPFHAWKLRVNRSQV